MHNRIILELFEKYKCPGTSILLQSTRCISNEQFFKKTNGQHHDLLSSLFYFLYFIFNDFISFSLCFPISKSFHFSCFFSRLYQVQQKSFCVCVCVCIHIYIIYNIIYVQFRKFMNLCLTKKKSMIYLLHLFDLG